MKFTISYARKVKAGQSYEMMEVFAALEGDTAVETMDQAFDKVRYFVDSKVDKERERLIKEAEKLEPKQ